MPTVRSMCHGGICLAVTRARIARAHGRASSYVTSDIGAIESGRWQASHFSRKIGATSLVKVTGRGAVCAEAKVDAEKMTSPARGIVAARNPAELIAAMRPPSENQ